MKRLWILGATAVALPLLFVAPAATGFIAGGDKVYCGNCHEIQQHVQTWRRSSHRTVRCEECHGAHSMFDWKFHSGNVRRLVTHALGEAEEQIQLQPSDRDRLLERCQSCHRQQFADWRIGPHGASFERILLDSKHNRDRAVMDDCLRCHGMYFQGGVRDLVSEPDATGHRSLRDASMASKPAIPCMACHSIHSEGMPFSARAGKYRSTLSFFDRRTQDSYLAADLALPAMLDGERAVNMSPDTRQTLCYQCHAALSTRQAGSADDRTPVGVHEGISCLGCHTAHGGSAKASCANCHPKMSNCGLDVEKMNTTFVAKSSPHDIHFVKCSDCHPKGVPPRRASPRSTPRSGGR